MRIPGSGLKKDNPAWPLLQAGIAYWGVTSANGNAAGTTLVCADLDNHPTFVNGVDRIKVLTGGAFGQDRLMTLHAAGGIITVDAAFTDAAGAAQQILAGMLFVILSSSGGGGGGGGGAPTLHASGTQLATGAEDIVATAAVAGKFVFIVDTLNMAAGDTLELRVYQKVLTGGSITGVLHFDRYVDVQLADLRIKQSRPAYNDLVEANALQFTLYQTTGVMRNYAWKVVSF
jgi:hypothetical protein